MPKDVLTTRTISPPSPSFPLSTCLKDAELAYSRYGHNHFSQGELANTLGLSAKSGPFKQRVASLKMYNLVVSPTNHKLTISETFERLHFAEKDSSDYKQAAHEAITHSTTFKALLQKFTEQLPDNHIVAKYLETGLGFNHKAATRAANTISASLAQTGLVDNKGNILSIRDEYSQPINHHPYSNQVLPKTTPPQILTAQIPVSHGNIVTIQYPQKISAQDADKITHVIAALTT